MSGAQSYLKQLGVPDEENTTQSNSAAPYIPSQQAIDKTAEEDFTTGAELIEKPIERGGQFKEPDLTAMRYAGPFASASPFMFLRDDTPIGKKRDDDPFREKRVKDLAVKAGGTYAYDNREVSDALGFKGQALLGFSDNLTQVSNAIEQTVGKGNFKIFEDKKANFLQNRFYVSVKKEDGEFTPFTSPTQSAFDNVQKFLPMGAYEVTTDVAAIGASFLTSGVISSLTGPLAPVTGPVTLGYSMYVFNKAGERGRQLLQDKLGLTKGEVDDFGTFVEEIQKLAMDPKAGLALKQLFSGGADITSNEFKQELRGIIGTVIPFFPGVIDKIITSMSRVRDSLKVQGSDLFESAVKAETFSDNIPVIAGGPTKLGSTMLTQRTMDKKIGRIGALVDQTSNFLSKMLRTQMQSAYDYMKNFKDNFGGGDFNKFRKSMSVMQTTLNDIKSGKITIDPEKLGMNLRDLEDLFFSLRMDESRGMYKPIFDEIGDRSLSLENIRNIIVSREVKTTVPSSKQVAGSPIEASSTPVVMGEPRVDSIIRDLIDLGVTSKGTRVLTKEGIAKAVTKLKSNHPEYAKYLEGNNIVIKTPAQLVHGYAVLLGRMSKGVFSKDVGSAPSGDLASFTQNLRRALLDTLSNPIVSNKFPKLDGISTKLAEANEFFATTLSKTESPLQVEARIASKTGGETAIVPDAIGLTEMATGPKSRVNVTLSNIKFQEEYLSNHLIGKIKAPLGKLQQAFADVISFKLAGAGEATISKTQSAENVKAYLSSFTKREKLNLGLKPDVEKELLKDIEIISKLDALQIAERYVLGSRIKNANLGEIFSSAINKVDDIAFKQDIEVMLDVIAKLPAKEGKNSLENIRGGLFDYIISKESGVLKEVTENNSVFAQIGDITIDPTALATVLDKLEKAGVFKNILNKKLTGKDGKMYSELDMLRGFQNYVGVISKSGTDAGSALSGAQLIGSLFTLNPKKLVEAITRLSAQGRVAKLFGNKAFADAVTGLGKPKATTAFGRMMERQKQYFFGNASISNIVAQFTLKGVQEFNRASDVSTQTDMMLNNSLSGANSYIKQMQSFSNETGIQ